MNVVRHRNPILMIVRVLLTLSSCVASPSMASTETILSPSDSVFRGLSMSIASIDTSSGPNAQHLATLAIELQGVSRAINNKWRTKPPKHGDDFLASLRIDTQALRDAQTAGPSTVDSCVSAVLEDLRCKQPKGTALGAAPSLITSLEIAVTVTHSGKQVGGYYVHLAPVLIPNGPLQFYFPSAVAKSGHCIGHVPPGDYLIRLETSNRRVVLERPITIESDDGSPIAVALVL